MKIVFQSALSFFALKVSLDGSSGWLQLVFQFVTENQEEQVKNHPVFALEPKHKIHI